MTRRPIIVLSLVPALGLALVGIFNAFGPSAWTSDPARYPQGRPFTVAPADLRFGIRATGSLHPRDFVPVASQINGKLEWVVDEGTRVKPGDVVARIEAVQYLDALDDAVSNLSIAQADLALEELQRDFTQRDRRRDLQRARINLDLAQLALDLLGAPSDVTVKLSELDLELKRLVLEAALTDSRRLESLASKGIADQHQTSVARLKYESARVDHAKALLDHERLLAPTPEEDLAVARQLLEQARTALDLAGKKETRDLNLCVSAVAVAQASVDRYRQLIDVQQRRVNAAQVAAPIAGTVIYPRPWGQPPLVGDQIWQGNRLVDIADVDVMAVDALVNQVDWPHLKPGQPAEIVLAADPNVTFTGSVLNLGGLAADRYLTLGGDVTGVMTFPVRILVNEKDPLLRPTYSAHLNIITEEVKSVCWVPRTALDRAPDGSPLVWLRQGGDVVPRSVKLGPQDAVRVVVSEGLKPGDVVIVPARK